ncbi:MAG TPA: hypothetical protein VLB50_02860 [Ignavibacteriaceae bacterium]|nr:hypothetical protein [Ignavibacteriaceae bacterium]
MAIFQGALNNAKNLLMQGAFGVKGTDLHRGETLWEINLRIHPAYL